VGRSEITMGSESLIRDQGKEDIDSDQIVDLLPAGPESYWGATLELSFVADLPAGETKTYYVYYMDDGKDAPQYPKLTNAVLDNPAYVAWESDAGAFRFYTGQFDFFGKQVQL